MKDNVDKVLNREEKLSDAESRSGNKFWLFCVFSFFKINVYLLDNKGIDPQIKDWSQNL